MEKIRLLLGEDEAITRMAFAHYIKTLTGYIVVGEAGNGIDLVEIYFKTNPDIVLCNINMPRMNGLDASLKILSRDKSAKIIFLTAYEDDEHLYRALQIGVRAFVTKNLMSDDWSSIVQKVFEEERYYLGKTESQIEEIKKKYCNWEAENKLDSLTTREKEIAGMVAAGMTSGEIAEQLNISKRTVDRHRGAIKEKTGFTKRSELVSLVESAKL